MFAVLDDSHAKCGCGCAVFRITHGEVIISTLLDELNSAVFIGEADNIFTLLHEFEAVGRGVGNDEVLHQLADVIPCFISVGPENGHDVAEIVPGSRGAVRVGEDNFALEFRVEQVSIGANVETEFLLEIRVDSEDDGGKVVHGVDAVRRGIAFDGISGFIGNPFLEQVGILHTVRICQTAPCHVALRVVSFCSDTRGRFTDRAGNNFNFAIGIDFCKAINQGFEVFFRHGGVENEGITNVFFCRSRNSDDGEYHAQGQCKCNDFLHFFCVSFLKIFIFLSV